MATALALSAATGFTLAYFTDYTQTDENTVTLGHVDISLAETSTASEGVLAGVATDDGFDYDNVMPGDVYSKEPVITVEADSQDCYVRALVTLTTTDSDEDGVITEADLLGYLDIDETLWHIGVLSANLDGSSSVYVYYNDVLSALDEVTLFTTVTFPFELDNDNTDDEYKIDVKAEAIQAQNVDPVRDAGTGMVSGWPAADIQQYQ